MCITLEAFLPAHIAGAVALSAQVGWPHRAEDWQMVLTLSDGIVALDGEQVVGTAMMTPFGTAAAAINMVIVDAALRGRGLGRRLMEHCLTLTAGRECRLTATEDGLPLYGKLGFRAVNTVVQHQGLVQPQTEVRTQDVAWCGQDWDAACAALDRAATGLDRGRLIAELFARGRVALLRHEGRAAGFVALRPFGRGEVAGPVVAETEEDAQALLSFVFAARPGAFLRIDTQVAPELDPWLAEQGLVAVGSGIAMRRDPAPERTPVDGCRFRSFALASQALG